MLCLLLLPFHLLFGLFLLPFVVLRAAFKLLAAIVLLPIVLAFAGAAVLVGALAFSLAVLVPLLPLAVLALVIWGIVKLAHPATV